MQSSMLSILENEGLSSLASNNAYQFARTAFMLKLTRQNKETSKHSQGIRLTFTASSNPAGIIINSKDHLTHSNVHRSNKMNKLGILLVIAVVAILALGSVGVAYAQSPTQTPGSGTGFMGGRGSRNGLGGVNANSGDGILHDYTIAAYAEALDIPVADLEARLDNGEIMAQIAISEGLTLEQFRTLMVEVRTQAIEQALYDGVLTQAQADWMSQRGAGQMAGGQMGNGSGMRGSGQGQFANPNCPYYNQTNP
jgi:hypothetical protein